VRLFDWRVVHIVSDNVPRYAGKGLNCPYMLLRDALPLGDTLRRYSDNLGQRLNAARLLDSLGDRFWSHVRMKDILSHAVQEVLSETRA